MQYFENTWTNFHGGTVGVLNERPQNCLNLKEKNSDDKSILPQESNFRFLYHFLIFTYVLLSFKKKTYVLLNLPGKKPYREKQMKRIEPTLFP